MKTTEVLLREHVKGLGRCGDIVRVAPGYARNYLIPKRIGIQATDDNKQAMERRRVRLDAEEAALLAEIDARLAAFSKLELKTIQRCDDHGHLYGSVNAMMIVSLLAEAGHEIGEKDVRLERPIKSVGVHQVTIHLHAERSGEVSVAVEGENGMTEVVKPPQREPEPVEEMAEELQAVSEGEAAGDSEAGES